MIRVFTDIDDTLMSTARKVAEADRVCTGALDGAGQPGSFCTKAQSELWGMLSQRAASITPVTARSQETFKRVQLSFSGPAVLDFGATILASDGTVDANWHSRMVANMSGRDDDQILALVATLVTGKHGEAVQVTTREANGILVFKNFRSSIDRAPHVAAEVRGMLKALAGDEQFYLHVTDRDVTVLPAFIRKGSAVAYLIESNGWRGDTLVGCGDSLTDCEFMALMDVAVVPGGSRNMHALATLAQEAEGL